MIKKIVAFGLGVVLLAACNTEFSVNGDYTERAIVHFLLDQGQEYHFLKLNKTFLKEGNALDFAKEAELSYFDNVEATVQEVIGGSVVRQWTLQDTIITNKKEGVFYGPEQKLYFFKEDNLNPEAIYRLKIDADNGNHIITGQTKLVTGVGITSPLGNQALRFAENNVQVNGYKTTPITFKVGDAATFKVELEIEYEETTSSGTETKSILWNLGSVNREDITAATSSVFASGEVFYEFLSMKISEATEGMKRNLTGAKIIVTAGSTDLYTYILSNKPTSSLAQNKPEFSNVDGALGIFSSRFTEVQVKPGVGLNPRVIDANSMRELCTGSYTVALGFCSQHPEDSGTAYSCN